MAATKAKPAESILETGYAVDHDTYVLVNIVTGSRTQAVKWADEHMPPYQCGPHAGDCCGRYFQPYRATVRQAIQYNEKVWLVQAELRRDV